MTSRDAVEISNMDSGRPRFAESVVRNPGWSEPSPVGRTTALGDLALRGLSHRRVPHQILAAGYLLAKHVECRLRGAPRGFEARWDARGVS